MLDAAAWDARLAVDNPFAKLAKAGHVTATPLTDDGARAHALQQYLVTLHQRPSNAAPKLPSLKRSSLLRRRRSQLIYDYVDGNRREDAR